MTTTLARPVAPTLAILVTRRCNMSCAHCSVESAPRVSTPDPTEAELLTMVQQAAAAGVKGIQFTGGEPMMRPKTVLRLMEETHRLGLTCGLTTNGFWGKNPRTARTTLRQMLRYGMQYMTVSYDRYHAEYMGPEPILNLAAIAADIGFTFNVNVTRTLADENLDEYARLFGDHPNILMRLYDVQPVGRARNFDLPSLRAETEGFCNAAAQATITEDGRMIACNGPAYFDPPDSPRSIGRLDKESIQALLHRHWDDPVLDTIRTFGPAGLRDQLLKDPRFVHSFDRRFAGQCDLCHHITSNPEMVAHLQDVLSQSTHQAHRAAKWAVIRGARSTGQLSRSYVNGPGMANIFYQFAATGHWPEDADKIFGRADIDWDHQAKYLGGSGLGNRLSSAISNEPLARWAPPYFGEALKKRAMADAFRELSHRETLDLIHDRLTALNLRAILLKGAALYLREREAGIPAARIPGDIDLYVESSQKAEALRCALIQAGFEGDPDAPRTGPHHLAPVSWRNSAVEIHTGIMPEFWGLPEKSMATDARPLVSYPQFFTLSAGDMILHEVVHSTSHLYSFGLKLALDIHRINRLASFPSTSGTFDPIDWQTVISRANATHCPAAFWVPLVALARGLNGQLPLPPEVLAAAPRSERLRKLGVVATHRLFSAVDNAEEMNPFTRNGIFLLLHDNMLTRLGYLASLTKGDAAESRRTAMQGSGGQSWKNLQGHLRRAWLDLKSYRKAVR